MKEEIKCDICNKKTVNLETIILYNKSITYCDKCEKKVLNAKLKFKREVNYQNTLLDINLKNAEKKIVKELKNSERKILCRKIGTEKFGTEDFV